jgi:hypothetical protein
MDFNTLTNQINFESLSGAQEEAPNYRRDNSLNSLVPQEENTCQRLDSFQNSLDVSKDFVSVISVLFCYE